MKIKYNIKDKKTLVIQEDAKKDDIIDLDEQIDIDPSNIDNLITDAIEKNNKKKIEEAIKEERNRNSKDKEMTEKLIRSEYETKYKERINELEKQIQSKNNEIENTSLKLENKYQEKINELNNKIKQSEMDITLAVNKSKEEAKEKESSLNYEIKRLNEELKNEKDYKSKLSVKMIGENLEQHCENSFNRLKSYGGYDNANFHKDNEVINGSKGDYIFEDYENEVKFISIMFELKNENENSTKKQKNSEFFEKLDKDRKNKNCEYAILVTCLEKDNALYEDGIYQVPGYEKMYVIRPQFFISIISLLRNISRKNIYALTQIEEYRKSDIDVTNFNIEMEEFKKKFGDNMSKAQKKFKEAIEEIDKTITHLNSVKSALISSENQLGYAGGKIDTLLTIKKLTKNSPSLKEKFKEAMKNNKDN